MLNFVTSVSIFLKRPRKLHMKQHGTITEDKLSAPKTFTEKHIYQTVLTLPRSNGEYKLDPDACSDE